MTAHFKTYTYDPPKFFYFTTPSETQFHNSLLNSQFLSRNPNKAHLFFVPFPHDFPTRKLSRFIQDLRQKFSYWNRTLGADHFFVSRAGIAHAPNWNVLQLRRNEEGGEGFRGFNFLSPNDVVWEGDEEEVRFVRFSGEELAVGRELWNWVSEEW
ncbi:probable glycosyltransferase At3g07620 [Actinidia eriantha]|uniref:probable glycosyltransferase At3g07620 n=1 Tax=Actinidia eriantha TaxID=165200 RepID=UPI00258CD91B|nr:probable glycosyltransferase At3g07620 [Actinidia eriantha]